MNILGVSCYYHDAAAALLMDGREQAATRRAVEYAPYTHYHYNNTAYRLLFPALAEATGIHVRTAIQAGPRHGSSHDGARRELGRRTPFTVVQKLVPEPDPDEAQRRSGEVVQGCIVLRTEGWNL